MLLEVVIHVFDSNIIRFKNTFLHINFTFKALEVFRK